MKIAVVTTFPQSYWNLCAAEMLASFKANWADDIKIFIQLDETEPFAEMNNNIVNIMGDRAYIASLWDEDQKAFMKRWEAFKPESYMFDVVRFSHKVFALEKCADALDDFDYLIWLDADVITKKQVTHEWLKSVLPEDGQVISYLARPWAGYSECGFVAYNLKSGGKSLLRAMKDMYVDDTFKNLQGWTDCHVLDYCVAGNKVKNLTENCNPAIGLDVFPHTKLGEKMVHRKGNRKVKVAQNRQNSDISNLSNMQIKTRNCVDDSVICSNINKNNQQIRNWVTILKPTNQDIVICAAGPSLVHYIDDIKLHQKQGAFIITVKHAIETLRAHGIIPDACVLLDPRGHVEKFVQEPDPRVVYFVASMVDPSVVKALNDKNCTVIGYHAAVNAGENKELVPCDLPIAGGSATSTRTIHMFADMFGYSDFHLYGYDLCHYSKPTKVELTEDGQPRIFEETFKVPTYNGKLAERTFWTEGQFLAQAQELRNLYKDRKDIKLNVYGDGIAGWMIKHQQLFDKYILEYNDRVSKTRENSITLKDYIDASTRANEFSRRPT